MLRFSLVQRTDSDRNETVTTAILGCFLVLTLSACDGRTPPLETAHAVVHGRITSASGEAVDDASVLSRTHFVSCDSAGVSQGVAYSRDDGTYVQHVVDLTNAKVACVTIEVDLLPIDGQDEADTTVATDLDLRYEPPYDSARTDVALKLAGRQ